LRETGKGEAMERGTNPSTVLRTLPSLQHYRSEIITTHPSLLIGESVGPGRLIRTNAAHDSHQIDDMAGLSGCRVATRRGNVVNIFNTKSHRTHYAMLHVEAVQGVEMACVKLSRQNCLPAGLQEALIKPYSMGAAGCECMLIAVPQTVARCSPLSEPLRINHRALAV
jgi:hypothetical protein